MQPPTPTDTTSIIRYARRMVAGVVILMALGVGAAVWYRATHLVVTNTRPTTGKTAATATNIVFWFNKPIAADTGHHLTISPAITGQATVKGTVLTFTPSRPLTDGRTYTATLTNVTSADHALTLDHAAVTFTVGYVPFDQQPKEVQDRGLKLTDNKPPTLTFLGEDQLLNQGVTADQVRTVEAFLKNTFDRTGKTDYAITIDHVTAAPYDPHQTDPTSTYTFTADINGTTYKAVLDAKPLGSVRIRLYNPTGKLVDDSAAAHHP